MAAWQIHATARDLYLETQDEEAAEIHRSLAEGHILTMANSFLPDEPLREIFLAAGPVHRMLAEKKQNLRRQNRKQKAATPDAQ